MISRNLQLLREWCRARDFRMVEMVEKAPPAEWAGEPDYTVTQIIQFVPKAPELMYAEVWLTDRDCLGLGIEPYERIAERAGVRTSRTRFVAGFEPHVPSFDIFAPALQFVASGEIAIDWLYLPIFGLKATAKAQKNRLSLSEAIRSIQPIYPLRSRAFPGFKCLRYAPWT